MKTKLTIGAYFNKVPGSVGISLAKGQATDKILDARLLDNEYAEFSVSEIFSFDMIEHIPTKDVFSMFKVWFRILEHGGRLEIGTVDLLGICREFVLSDLRGRKSLINHFYGSQSFPSDFHQTGFTFEILEEYLSHAGFINIHRCSSAYRNWSGTLLIEAFKP